MVDVEFLTVEQILDAEDLLTAVVDIPEWNGKVKVRGLTAQERNSLARKARVNGGPKSTVTIDSEKAQFAVVQMGMIEPKIAPELFEPIMRRSASAVGRIYDKIVELSGMKTSGAEEESAAGLDFQII